MSKTLPI